MYAANFENPWIRAAGGAPRPAAAGWAALIAAVWAGGVLFGASTFGPALADGIAGALHGVAGPWPAIAGELAVDILVYGLLFAAALLATTIEGRGAWLAGRLPAAWSVAGLAIGALGFAAAVAVAWIAGAVHPGAEPPLSGPAGGIAVGLLLVVFQSSAEEVYFRGWLQPVLCARWGPWLGLAATSAMFAALHVVAGARGALAIVNLFLGGVLFGLLALRTGGLWAPAAAHFAWNWTESGALGLDPNPGVGPTGALLDLDLGGPALWSGGADTMNGSLASSLVLAVLVIGLVLLGPRTRPTNRG